MFDYRIDAFSNRLSSCYLRVYKLPDNVAVVIATELAENKGPSVTNSAEAWATEAVTEYGLDQRRTYFVEHYDARSYAPPRRLRDEDRETYDFVSFLWDGDRGACQPKWRPSTREEIEKLVGQSLEE
jgi:hypothetical protein